MFLSVKKVIFRNKEVGALYSNKRAVIRPFTFSSQQVKTVISGATQFDHSVQASSVFSRNLLQWNLDLTNLYITKSSE